MSSFFLKKGGNRKRKAPVQNGRKIGKKKTENGSTKRSKPEYENEEIPSSEADTDLEDAYEDLNGLDPNEVKETAEEKRLRLAKAYLEEIEKIEKEKLKDEQDLSQAVNQRLQRDNLEEVGKLCREVAHLYQPVDEASIKLLRDKYHKLAITQVVVSSDSKWLFSASKDAGIVKWDLKSLTKLKKLPGGRKGKEDQHVGHCTTVNAMALSTDGKFLASGDDSKLIHVWNTETMERIKTFKGHRDAITGLAFRKRTHTLYSASADRTVKHWSLDEMSYVETLFGHQDKITGIDAGLRERAVTSGGRDGSVRVWKIVEDSQLVFNGPAMSIDCVKLINEDHFVTCGEDGHLSLWGTQKKRPLCTVPSSHGVDPKNGVANWVSAVAALPMTDLVASGSCDGFVRLWKCGPNFRSLENIIKIPVKGFVNSLAFAPDGLRLVVGVGQEHRLGRWQRIKEAKNSILVVPLTRSEDIEL